MELPKFKISPFKEQHQPDIDLFMEAISKEFAEPIYSPQSKKIKEAALLPTDKYWVAVKEDRAVGTIVLSLIKNDTIAVKRMFLNHNYRGQGIADALLETLINYCIKQTITDVYLGTMIQFKAAQTFYERNGFKRISEAELPSGFPANPVDKVFYKRKIE